MNKKDFKSWCKDFSVSHQQADEIRKACSDAVELFKTTRTKPPLNVRAAMQKFKKLEAVLCEIDDREAELLAVVAITGNTRMIQQKSMLMNFARIGKNNFRWLCNRAAENYKSTKLSAGGSPERIPGRRLLALEIAMAMQLAGIPPTKTPSEGAFDRLLRIVFRAAGIITDDDPNEFDKDLKAIIDYSVNSIKSMDKSS